MRKLPALGLLLAACWSLFSGETLYAFFFSFWAITAAILQLRRV